MLVKLSILHKAPPRRPPESLRELSADEKKAARRRPFQRVEKAARPLFRERLHGGRGSFSCEKVTSSAMRSVISEAHPPGGPLLPLRGNSPCVLGNDRFSLYSAACGRRNSARLSLTAGFSTALKGRPKAAFEGFAIQFAGFAAAGAVSRPIPAPARATRRPPAGPAG